MPYVKVYYVSLARTEISLSLSENSTSYKDKSLLGVQEVNAIIISEGYHLTQVPMDVTCTSAFHLNKKFATFKVYHALLGVTGRACIQVSLTQMQLSTHTLIQVIYLSDNGHSVV